MMRSRSSALGLTMALALGACSFAEESLWPTLSGEDPAESVAIAPSEGEVQASPTIGGGTVDQASLAGSGAVGNTGTAVGGKVATMSAELAGLQGSIAGNGAAIQALRAGSEQKAQRYYATVAAITARLQVGTTPGNPVLLSQWNTAQGELDGIAVDIGRLNGVANAVATDAGVTSYLLDAIRATYRLSGAIDEDHRQLAQLEDNVNRTIVAIDRLLRNGNEAIERQTAYVNNERRHLAQLALAINSGEIYRPSLGSTTGFVGTAAVGASAPVPGGPPLVVIRFDTPDVAYRQALYTAVSQALDRQPAAVFDLVAVAPNRGSASEVALANDASRRYAEDVLRSLGEMGLPAERITLSSVTSPDVATNEVRIFVR